MKEIRTTEKNWLNKLAIAYKEQKNVLLIDDANIGIDPNTQTIFHMGKINNLTMREWVSLGVSIGLGAAGMYMIIAGIADPEPTSKLGLLIGGGVVCVVSGGFSAIWILTGKKPPKIRLNKNGFIIEWE
jgi:hypothetical protein